MASLERLSSAEKDARDAYSAAIKVEKETREAAGSARKEAQEARKKWLKVRRKLQNAYKEAGKRMPVTDGPLEDSEIT